MEPETPPGVRLFAGCCFVLMALCSIFAVIPLFAQPIATGIGTFWAEAGAGVQIFLTLCGVSGLVLATGTAIAINRRPQLPSNVVTYRMIEGE